MFCSFFCLTFCYLKCKGKGKGKGKLHPRTGHEGPEYRCNLSLTSALDVGGWLTSRPGRFTPRKQTRYPLYRRLGETPGPFWTGAEILAPMGIRPLDRRARSSVAIPTELSRLAV
jgi:hypothetical protein